MRPNFYQHLDNKKSYALFKNLRTVDAREAIKSTRSLIYRLTTPTEFKIKDVNLFGPYRLADEKKRANRNIESISALVFDIDNAQGKSFQDIFELVADDLSLEHFRSALEESRSEALLL